MINRDFKIGDFVTVKTLDNDINCAETREAFECGDISYIKVLSIDSGGKFINKWEEFDEDFELVNDDIECSCSGLFVRNFKKVTRTYTTRNQKADDSCCDQYAPHKNPVKNTMRTLSTLAKKMFDADTKALVEAGVLDECLGISDDTFVLSYLVNLHKKELAVLAREQLAEDKEARKNNCK